MSANTLWDLSGKVILVTGATGALAGEAAQYLLQQGAKVIFMSRSQERIDKAISRAGENQSLASGYPCDVSDRGGLETVAARIRDQHGKLDALINGAGGNQPGATIAPGQSVFDLDLNDYDKVMDLNLKGTLLPSLVFGKMMSEQGAGSIINFSSASSLQVLTRVLGYSNAKAAVDNLTRWMAVDFAQKHGTKFASTPSVRDFSSGSKIKLSCSMTTARSRSVVSKSSIKPPWGASEKPLKYAERSIICSVMPPASLPARSFMSMVDLASTLEYKL
jgi:NAD(P)-dependent dehydrogenase (short-subunit alcohol dehydrogenase family)